jgi:RNA polymerase sigma-70 factor (ECF subfamily)
MSQRPDFREDPAAASVTLIDDGRTDARTDARRALVELTREHGPYLHGLARKLCRAQLDPDDLVQDVLERTLRSPIPPGANARAWLARVMHNLFIDRLRRRQARREELTDTVEEVGAGVLPAQLEERAWWEAITEDEVRAQVARLPEEQRTTFELFAFAGASYDDIAARLGIAKATVGTRILRARQKLREQLTKERGDG